uniref:Uncharacterized protein n=1 Tax=Sphaerodactylus townsendi TaxID=933632 RepID=A0ACB8F3S7_9SAUR
MRFELQAIQHQLTVLGVAQPTAGARALNQAAQGGVKGGVAGAGQGATTDQAGPAPPAPRLRKRYVPKLTLGGSLPRESMSPPAAPSALVADYGTEFWQLASHLCNWPERIFIHMFKDGLDAEVLQWARVSGDPDTFMGSICLVGDSEGCLKEVQCAEQ